LSPSYWSQKRYIDRLHSRLIQALGGKCEFCGALAPLEFAHRQPTGLSGRGRGRKKRLLDVNRHIDSYRLLCSKCHYAYDHSSELSDVNPEAIPAGCA